MIRLSSQYLVTETELAEYRNQVAGALGKHAAAAIEAASADIVERTRRAFIKEAITVTADGDRSDGRNGQVVKLPYGPVDTTAAVTVTEDGTALTVATAYSTTADVVVDGVKGWLHRRPGVLPLTSRRSSVLSWAEGVMNIVVTCTVGDADDETGVAPPVKQAVCELAWLYMTQRPGTTSTSRRGLSASWSGQLSASAESTLRRYTRW